ncbi:MAG: helix-turn-helix transcriptional regulator [Oscillospiraceae bacterium]|nr:helix-turn-helix transcriptional regulator [Oscillospiraceae bacterium]
MRKDSNLTQKDIASLLNMTARQYQRIESGVIIGKVEVWDALEDFFGIGQRLLRKNTDTTEIVASAYLSLTQKPRPSNYKTNIS